jgi:hypothetical protein
MSSETASRVFTLLREASVFLVGAILVTSIVHLGVPALAAGGVDQLAAWMMLSVPLVFLPIVAGGFLVLRAERVGDWKALLRLQRPSRGDWLWGLGRVLGIGLGSGAMFYLCSIEGLVRYSGSVAKNILTTFIVARVQHRSPYLVWSLNFCNRARLPRQSGIPPHRSRGRDWLSLRCPR